ncbi:hypothetical protein GCM10022261_02190 [Brevibacterium daeguense]|uniref:Uncharacterized protein n=1 Tax=Brevibacterium daeguense TaxID=909936 RepID=A0ABP8EFC5_9MICO
MKTPGGRNQNLLVRARSVLIDALEALHDHRDAVIVVGAQAVYLRTDRIRIALAEATKDSDVVLDPGLLSDDPLLEEAMKGAGFLPSSQPGSWLTVEGIPVDLMVPDSLAGRGRRSAQIPPHDKEFSSTSTWLRRMPSRL